MKLFSKKGLALLLIGTSFAACSTVTEGALVGEAVDGAAPPSLTEHFNGRAIGGRYALGCERRESVRAVNIREPVRPGQPDYFSRDENKVALYSPHLTESQKEEARELIRSLPPHVMDLIYPTGAVFVFTARSLGEAAPYYETYRDEHGDHPYNETFVGMYTGGDRRIYLTYNIAQVRENEKGEREVAGYLPMSDNKYRVLYHEVGHFIDDMVGEIGASFLEFGSKRFSDRAVFQDALAADLDAIAAPDSGHSRYYLELRDYFLPPSHNGVTLHGQHEAPEKLRGEVFAELWAEAQGRSTVNLSRLYPRAFEVVKALDEALVNIHEKRGRNCSVDPERLRFNIPILP